MWRQEIPYVMEHLDMVLRPQLELMMEWKIGMEHQFAVNVGKSGKYLSRYLSREEYRSFLATYSSAEPEAIWKSVFIMCELFDRMAKEVSRELGFQYDQENADNSAAFLRRIKDLPLDAERIM